MKAATILNEGPEILDEGCALVAGAAQGTGYLEGRQF